MIARDQVTCLKCSSVYTSAGREVDMFLTVHSRACELSLLSLSPSLHTFLRLSLKFIGLIEFSNFSPSFPALKDRVLELQPSGLWIIRKNRPREIILDNFSFD